MKKALIAIIVLIILSFTVVEYYTNIYADKILTYYEHKLHLSKNKSIKNRLNMVETILLDHSYKSKDTFKRAKYLYLLKEKQEKELLAQKIKAKKLKLEELEKERKAGEAAKKLEKALLNVKFVVKPAYKKASKFSEGLAYIEDATRTGYINKAGKFVINTKRITENSEFKNGIATGSKALPGYNKFQYYLIYKSGKIKALPEQIQLDPVVSFSSGLMYFFTYNTKGEKLGYIDTNGNIIMKPAEAVLSFCRDLIYDPDFNEGLAVRQYIKDKDKTHFKYSYINNRGEEVLKPVYDGARKFSEGLAAVSINRRCYYIDKNGTIKIDPHITLEPDARVEYALNNFSEGMAAIRNKDGLTGFLDKTGKMVIPQKFTYTEGIDSKFQEGFVAVDVKGKYAFLDKNGNFAINPQDTYKFVGNFSEGLAVVENIKGKYGFINKTGKFVIPQIFDDAISFSQGMAAVKLQGKWGYIVNPLKTSNTKK